MTQIENVQFTNKYKYDVRLSILTSTNHKINHKQVFLRVEMVEKVFVLLLGLTMAMQLLTLFTPPVGNTDNTIQ